jgi:hypothetical protein
VGAVKAAATAAVLVVVRTAIPRIVVLSLSASADQVRAFEDGLTGLSFFAVDLMLKRFDLLMELAPQIRRLTVIVESPPHWSST